MSGVQSKDGKPIHKGDHVYTKIRGGRHEGDVSFPVLVIGMATECRNRSKKL
jgi:hypothetical protein